MLRIFDRIATGSGSAADLITLEEVAHQIQGKCFCALGEFAIQPVLGTLNHFRAEYEMHIE
jgi:NADH-quinone oxidoreductase subunit F